MGCAMRMVLLGYAGLAHGWAHACMVGGANMGWACVGLDWPMGSDGHHLA